jgi:hypothetical protein
MRQTIFPEMRNDFTLYLLTLFIIKDKQLLHFLTAVSVKDKDVSVFKPRIINTHEKNELNSVHSESRH